MKTVPFTAFTCCLGHKGNYDIDGIIVQQATQEYNVLVIPTFKDKPVDCEIIIPKEDIPALIKALQEVAGIEPEAETIGGWSTEDIHTAVEEMNEDRDEGDQIVVTEEEAGDILDSVIADADMNTGINWDFIREKITMHLALRQMETVRSIVENYNSTRPRNKAMLPIGYPFYGKVVNHLFLHDIINPTEQVIRDIATEIARQPVATS